MLRYRPAGISYGDFIQPHTFRVRRLARVGVIQSGGVSRLVQWCNEKVRYRTVGPTNPVKVQDWQAKTNEGSRHMSGLVLGTSRSRTIEH